MTQESYKNIDQIMRERLTDFGSVPGKNVWDNIDNKLSGSKKRRKVLAAGITAGVFLTASLTYILWPGSTPETVTEHREVAPVIKSIKNGEITTTPSLESNEVVTPSEEVDVKSEYKQDKPQKTPELNPATNQKEVDVNSDKDIEQVVDDNTGSDVSENTRQPRATIIDAMRPNSLSPSKVIPKDKKGILEKNDTLTLSIEFANLERKMADKITIEQSVPAFLDINTLKPVESSHTYKYKVKKGQGKIIWTLKDIPASGLKGSKGYIDYDIVVIKKANEAQLKSKEVVTYDYGYYRTKSTQ